MSDAKAVAAPQLPDDKSTLDLCCGCFYITISRPDIKHARAASFTDDAAKKLKSNSWLSLDFVSSKDDKAPADLLYIPGILTSFMSNGHIFAAAKGI